MELKIHKDALDTLLAKVYPLVPPKSTMLALSNILLEAREGKVYASATDLETSGTAIGPAEILKEGEIAINGKDLYNITRELPSATLELRVDNLLATIQCERGKFTMTGTGKEEFPKLLEVKGERMIDVPHTVLEKAIDKTLFASSAEMESVLGGALLDLQQEELRLAATDGRKLALFKKKMDIGKIARLLVASKVWREVSKFTSGIKISFEENTIGFHSEDMTVVSRLMEGEKFPPYESVIPKDNDKLLLVSKNEFTLALRRALVFSPDISKLIKLRLASNTLLIEATSETGEAKEELSCKYEAPELEIAYNGSYLISIIGKIEADEIKVLFKDPESAALITPAEQSGEEEIIYLLMPIRLE